MALENSNIELVKILNDNFKNPFIALSSEGNFISYNKRAAELFRITAKTGNIFDFFDRMLAIQFHNMKCL